MTKKGTNLTEAEERRREQNRLAQRRFRQKQNLRKQAEQRERTRSLSADSRWQDSRPGEPPMLPESLHMSHPAQLSPEACDRNLHHGVGAYGFFDDLKFTNMDNFWIPTPELSPAPTGTLPGGESSSDASEAAMEHLMLEGVPYSDSQILADAMAADNSSSTTTPPGSSSGSTSNGNGIMMLDPLTGDVTTTNSTRASPLHLAVQKGNGRIVRLLLKHHADCNRRDSAGLTPLLYAAAGGHEEVTDLLLAHGASLHHVDLQHRSALHWAVLHRRDRLLRKLLKHCAADATLVNGYTKDGRTPLHVAVDTGFEEAVELLLQYGAKV